MIVDELSIFALNLTCPNIIHQDICPAQLTARTNRIKLLMMMMNEVYLNLRTTTYIPNRKLTLISLLLYPLKLRSMNEWASRILSSYSEKYKTDLEDFLTQVKINYYMILKHLLISFSPIFFFPSIKIMTTTTMMMMMIVVVMMIMINRSNMIVKNICIIKKILMK